MKEIILISLNLLMALSLTCQETKLIIRNFNDSKQIAEKYSVLKSDGKTKHGEYVSYFRIPDQQYKSLKNEKRILESYIKVKANYKEGKKDGEWEEYDRPFSLRTKGKYLNDKKIGIWQIVKESGQVIESFNYDNGQKLPPIIQVFVEYPYSAKESLLEGTVVINFKTNKDCSVTDITITKNLSKDCDKSAIQWINRISELRKKYGAICEEKTETREIKFKLE